MGIEQSHETCASSTKDHIDGYRYWADFDSEYFAKGTYRYAFRGTIHGDGPRDGELCVAKVFKKNKYSDYFDKWRPDLEASYKAQRFAEIFTENVLPNLKNYITTESIEFVVPLIARMDIVSHFKVLGLFSVGEDSKYVEPQEHVAIEPYLPGEFEKYNSNGGYEDTTAAVVNTFCHWTWQVSGHRYLVCDAQGIQKGRRYILTDPCIHSIDGRFGMTDLMVVGMETFLANHDCNPLCKKLGLKNPLEEKKVKTRKSKATTYMFQLSPRELLKADNGMSPYFNLDEVIVE